jgi:hypothetical protein
MDATGERMISPSELDTYLKKHINQICPNDFTRDAENHCAHFVSHVLGYQFGVTCSGMGKANAPGASIRVQSLFPHCPSVGKWDSRPASRPSGLVFITNPSNVNLASKIMVNVPRKHVGIYYGDWIWHYSNSQQKVIKETPEQFSHHYPAPDNAMFYGFLP